MGVGVVPGLSSDGFGMVPSRYPWTPRAPAADQIVPCHSNQLFPSKRSSVLLLYSIFLFDVKILNVAPCVSRRGMYACVRRWAIYVRPRGV